MFAAGFDFDLTFGLMHTAEKSRNSGKEKAFYAANETSDDHTDEFRHLAKGFGVTLPEEFLYEK